MQIGTQLARPRRSGTAIYFSAAAALALVVGVLVASAIRQASPTDVTYVLARTLPAGTILRAGDLQEKLVPPGAVPEGAVRSLDAAVGKRLKTAMLKGDYVRGGHLAQGATGYLPERLAEMGAGVRALVLPAEVVPHAAQLAPRDRLELSAVVTSTKVGQSAAVAVGSVTVVELLKGGDGSPQGVLVAAGKDIVPRIVLALRSGPVTAAVAPAQPGAAQAAELTAADRAAIEEDMAPHDLLKLDDLIDLPPTAPLLTEPPSALSAAAPPSSTPIPGAPTAAVSPDARPAGRATGGPG